MQLAIVRTYLGALDPFSYNVQELGLAKGLLRCGASTDFYSFFENVEKKKNIEQVQNGCEVKLIPLKNKIEFLKITYLPNVIRTILQERYDVVQVHEDLQLMTPFILNKCKKNGIKTVLYQGVYKDLSGIKKIYNWGFDLFFKKMIQKNADVVLAKTEMAKRYLEGKGYKNVSILPIGLDFTNRKNLNAEQLSEIQCFKSKFKNIVLYVGRMEKRRNPKFTIDVLSKLNADTGLIMIGNGPLYDKTVEYARDRGLIGRVLFVKSVPNDEIFDIYKMANVFVLPSNYEIYGMVILEALFNGIPALSTPTAGGLSILNDKRLGVCLSLNVDTWAEHINFYLSDDKPEDKIYRQNEIRNKYNWEHLAAKYYEIIKSTI